MLKPGKILLVLFVFVTLVATIFIVCCALFFDRRVSHHPVDACLANLKQIEGAKAAWAMEYAKQTNDVPAWTNIIGETNYIYQMPICPSNGTYTLRSVGELPLCSVHGHVLPPGR